MSAFSLLTLSNEQSQLGVGRDGISKTRVSVGRRATDVPETSKPNTRAETPQEGQDPLTSRTCAIDTEGRNQSLRKWQLVATPTEKPVKKTHIYIIYPMRVNA